MAESNNEKHKIVIVGGGAAGLELATGLGQKLGKKGVADVTLIDAASTHIWKPLLHEVAAGTLQGLTEESFSMGWESKYIRIWWSGKAYSNFGTTHEINGIEDAKYNAKEGDLVIDPLAEDSPIQIDWNSWLSATTKYYKRNAPFKIKEII